MGEKPNVKPKKKPRDTDDEKQSERFIETARRLGAEEGGPLFDSALDRIVVSDKRS